MLNSNQDLHTTDESQTTAAWRIQTWQHSVTIFLLLTFTCLPFTNGHFSCQELPATRNFQMSPKAISNVLRNYPMWYQSRLLLSLGDDLPGISATQWKSWGPGGNSTGLWPQELSIHQSLPLSSNDLELQSVLRAMKEILPKPPGVLESFRKKQLFWDFIYLLVNLKFPHTERISARN